MSKPSEWRALLGMSAVARPAGTGRVTTYRLAGLARYRGWREVHPPSLSEVKRKRAVI